MPALTHNRVKNGFNGGIRKNNATMGVVNVVADGITNTPVSARLGATTGEKGLPDDAVVQTEEILSEEENVNPQ